MVLIEDKAQGTNTFRMGIFPELQIHGRYHVWCFSIQLMTEIPLIL